MSRDADDPFDESAPTTLGRDNRGRPLGDVVEDLEDLALGEDYALNPAFVAMVVDATDRGDAERLRELLAALRPADVADLMGFLSASDREEVVAKTVTVKEHPNEGTDPDQPENLTADAETEGGGERPQIRPFVGQTNHLRLGLVAHLDPSHL